MNILIVDDEIYTLNETELYVKKYGNFENCITCSNAIEALEYAEKVPFDIALLDIEMPIINGVELAAKLSDIFPSISIAFITAYNNYAAEAFNVNAVDYVLKPIRKERLFKTLDKLTGKKANELNIDKSKEQLYINTFGKFTVRIGDELLKWNRLKCLELLAYLLENKDSPVHKEKLCDLLWPNLEPQKALASLQTTIYYIRKNLASYNCEGISIEYSGNNYLLRIKGAYIDSEEFEQLIVKASELKDLSYLYKAIKLYSGNYLEEEGWLWAEAKKQALRRKYITALKKIRS